MPTAPRARDRAESMAPGKRWTGRMLHQTTFSLGDQTPCYSTTHTKSFSGRRFDGQPLIFHLSDPPYPSQHLLGLDLRNVSEGPSFSSTHSKDVHSPKEVTPHDVLRSLRNRNWTRNRDGLAMKEVTNPPGSTLYRSSYSSDHCGAELSGQFEHASGRPTLWHRHDILTGVVQWLMTLPVCLSVGESRSVRSAVLRREQLPDKTHIHTQSQKHFQQLLSPQYCGPYRPTLTHAETHRRGETTGRSRAAKDPLSGEGGV